MTTRLKMLLNIACGITLFFLTNGSLYAQQGLFVIGGVAKYELANIGLEWGVSETFFVTGIVGSNFGAYDKALRSTGLLFGQTFQIDDTLKLRSGYSLGAILWTQDDELYFFKTMTFPIMIVLAYPLTQKINMKFEGGAVLSEVLKSDRKQNISAAYPKRIDANFKFTIAYKLFKNEK